MIPDISVVIPTYQRRDLALASVRALDRQTFAGPFEVIVVVDGSADGSADALRALELKTPLTVLEQQNQGAASARNRGAGSARGDILLFLDDDMEAAPDLLTEHVRCHRDGADVVFGHLPLHPSSPSNFLSRGVGYWAEMRMRRLTTAGEQLTLHDLLTGQMSLQRRLFEQVGGFDVRFTGGGTFGDEDIDFGYRLRRDGYRLVFNKNAISFQNYVVTPRRYLEQYRQTGRADVAFARKHPDQARVLFELNGASKRINRYLWRPLASWAPISTPVMNVLRSLALRVTSAPHPGDTAERFFYQVWALEYWRGVHEAGGMPGHHRLRVLAYHAIRDLPGAPVISEYAVPPARFREQIAMLKRLGFAFVSPDEVVCFIREEGGLPARPVFLTFDDAYRDLLEVLPFLREHAVGGAVFVVSGQLGGHNAWDVARGAPRLDLLDVAELRRVVDHGIETGAHSRTHRPLTSLSDRDLADETRGAADDLQRAGLRRPRMFAYPEGESDDRARHAVRSAGLDVAFTVIAGSVRAGDDPYSVPRIEILRSDGRARFLWKVLSAPWRGRRSHSTVRPGNRS